MNTGNAHGQWAKIALSYRTSVLSPALTAGGRVNQAPKCRITRGPKAMAAGILAVGVAGLLVADWSTVVLRAAGLAWSTAETIALTCSGTTVTGLGLSLSNGRAAAVWLEDSQVVAAAYRPSGGPFSTRVPLDTQTNAFEPSIAVGTDGKAVVAWAGSNDPGPVRTVAVSEVAAGTTTFSAKTTIFTSSMGQNPGDTSTGIDASGRSLVVFRGDSTFNPYNSIWSAERAAGGGAWSVNRRTGNYEVAGTRLALGSDGWAFAYAWGISQGISHFIGGPHRNSSLTWFGESAAYSGATIGVQGPVSLVIDGSDRGYMTIDVCCNGGSAGPNFVMVNSDGSVPQGALNPDAASFSPSGPASLPRVVVDAAGNAVMTWIRTTGTSELWTAYRAAGTATTFSAPELIATGIASNNIGGSSLAMDSAGNAVVVWKDSCASGTCTLRSKIRPAGAATSFGTPLVISSTAQDSTTLAIAADGVRNVGVIWRDSASPVNLKYSVLSTGVPTQIAITSSTDPLLRLSGRSITAEMRDVSGAVVTTDNSTVVTFAKTAGTGSVAGLGSSGTASGIATKAVVANAVGTISITASSSGLPSDTTTFSIVLGPPHHLRFTDSSAGTLASGSSRTLMVEVRDANDNVVTDDNSTSVTFSLSPSSGSVSGLPGSATAVSGVASLVVTGNVVGSVAIAASATGLSGDSTTFNVDFGAPYHLTFTSSNASLVSGTGRTLTAEIRDVNENLVTLDSSTSVTFAQTSGAGSVTGLAARTAVHGIASLSVIGRTGGSVTITASAVGHISGTTTFTVTPGAPVSLAITSTNAPLAIRVSRTLTAEIRDAADNRVTSDNSTSVLFQQTSGSGAATGFTSATASAGIASIAVTGSTGGTVAWMASASGLVSGTSSFTVTSTPVFTDDPLTAGSSTIKLLHLTELRDAIAALRSRTGLSAFAWTDSPATAGTTTIKAVHITELRTALNQVYAAISVTPPSYTDSTLIAGTTPFKVAHIAELRAAILAIW